MLYNFNVITESDFEGCVWQKDFLKEKYHFSKIWKKNICLLGKNFTNINTVFGWGFRQRFGK